MAETARQTASAEGDDLQIYPFLELIRPRSFDIRTPTAESCTPLIDFLIYFTIDRSRTHARTVVVLMSTSGTYSRSKAKQEQPKHTGTHHHMNLAYLFLLCAKKKDLLIDESPG
jgi:hypothetical protein